MISSRGPESDLLDVPTLKGPKTQTTKFSFAICEKKNSKVHVYHTGNLETRERGGWRGGAGRKANKVRARAVQDEPPCLILGTPG